MSTVRNDRYDEIKKIREYYKEREEELKAQQAKEKKKLAEVHKKNLKELEERYSTSEDNRRDETRTAISKSDMKHTDDIEKLKGMHAKQMRAAKERQAFEEENYKKAYEENAERKENLYRNKLAERERANNEVVAAKQQELSETISQYQDRHQEEVSKLKEDHLRAQEKTKKISRRGHDEEKGAISNEYANYRSDKEQEITRLEKRHRYEMQKLKNNYERILAQKDRTNSNIVENMREDSIDGVKREKQQYNKAVAEREKALRASWDSLEDNHEEKVDHLSFKIRQLEEQNIRDHQKMMRAKNREVENLQISYQDNIDKLVDQRSEIIKQNNEIKYNEVALANQRADERIADAYQYYKGKMEEESDHNDANMARMQRRLAGESIQKQMMTDYRFKKIQDDYARDRAMLQKHHTKVLDSIKSEMNRTLHSERDEHVDEQRKMREYFETRIAGQEVKHLEDLEKLKQGNERVVEELRMSYQKELNELQAENERALEHEQKTKDAQIKNQQAAFDYRLKKMEEAYQSNLKRLDTKHEQSVRHLSQQRDGKGKYA